MIEFTIATILRSVIMKIFEPELFELFPDIPGTTYIILHHFRFNRQYAFLGIVLSWNMLRTGYLPQRTTLFLNSFLNGCILGPVVEEVAKLHMMRSMIAQRSTKVHLDSKAATTKNEESLSSPVSGKIKLLSCLQKWSPKLCFYLFIACFYLFIASTSFYSSSTCDSHASCVYWPESCR